MSVMQIEVIEGDITQLKVDILVRPANSDLTSQPGVSEAILKVAGHALAAQCRRIGPCPTGQAMMTAAYQLQAKHVIHTVGPVYSANIEAAPRLLEEAYTAAFKLADTCGYRSIAFPCLGTDSEGFPPARAAKIAFSVVDKFVKSTHYLEHVIFCCHDRENFALYTSLLNSER